MSSLWQSISPSAQREVSQRVQDEMADGAHTAAVAFDIDEERRHRERVNLLRRPEVEARTGLSRSSIYEWMKRGEFPQPVRLGARIVAWRESDVAEWLESLETRLG
jgi:prophage regulatory protein